jgi:hypothetical protein
MREKYWRGLTFSQQLESRRFAMTFVVRNLPNDVQKNISMMRFDGTPSAKITNAFEFQFTPVVTNMLLLTIKPRHETCSMLEARGERNTCGLWDPEIFWRPLCGSRWPWLLMLKER